MKNETLEEAAEKYSLELLEAKTIQPHEKTWIKSMFIYIANSMFGRKEEPKQDLGYTTKMGIKITDEFVRTTMIPKEKSGMKEEPKQETLEEAFSQYVNEKYHSPTQGSIPDLESARFGAKWQAERMFSDEEVLDLLAKFRRENRGKDFIPFKDIQEWFEKFKKK
jgi:hypothetical protein